MSANSNGNLTFHFKTACDMGLVRTLFQEYAAELGHDLCFQGFDEELATLPGKYSSPNGALLIAFEEGSQAAAGIVALRPLDSTSKTCEMKRMYVRPAYRGVGLGRMLAQRIIEDAQVLGYEGMVLDTLTKLGAAIALYRSLGFVDIEPYYENPIEGVLYLGLEFWEKT